MTRTRNNKQWREFEKLLTKIERFLAPHGATIKSPDHLPDLTTGTLREVDACIRFKIGSTPIVITFECRHTAAKQNVTWIEQLAAKKTNLGISETIGVSLNGFTEEAKRKAKTLGIRLRKIDKIQAPDILSLLRIEVFESRTKEIGNLQIVTRFNKEAKALDFFDQLKRVEGEVSPWTSKIAFSVRNNKFFSFSEIAESIIYKIITQNKGFPEHGKDENSENRIRLVLHFYSDDLYIPYLNTKLYPKRIEVDYLIENKFEQMFPKNKFDYIDAQSGEKLSELFQFESNNTTFKNYDLNQEYQSGKYSLSISGIDRVDIDITTLK